MKLKTSARFCSAIFVLLLVVTAYANGPKFMEDDPVWKDPDNESIPKPAEVDPRSGIYDFVENSFVRTRDKTRVKAQNINTLGEVPDSSWFTNRIGRTQMSVEEITRGPDQRTGPERTGFWTITRAKTQGITPGFTIKDSRGDTYFIKFDPVGWPQLSTSSEVIVTKLFHTFGYHVAENYIAILNPEQLRISPEAKLTDEDGTNRSMTQDDVSQILKKVARLPDGRIQVVASLRLKGEPVGPFKYYGTRSDDPNDIFPHENRRELRGMRVFSAWLNHDDSRSLNSLDMYVTEDDRKYVKHYLIDFGSTLGSGSVRAQSRRAGNEYIIEGKPMVKSAATLGIWDRPWRKVNYPDYKAIGRFESKYFRPERWKPEYPNPAFDRMDMEDAFWATRIVARFTDSMIRSVVRTGQIVEKEAEEYLIQAIIERRDKVIRYYLGQVNALDEFKLDGSTLTFVDLAAQAGVSSGSSYEYQWFRFSNDTGALKPIGAPQSTRDLSTALPSEDAEFLMARIHNVRGNNWKKKVDVYVRNKGDERSVVGIERE